ncbi:MAG TPA: threonine aldolase, partial [Bacteroidales bacterium]|nr:threonine aldolase [Bacteroidales bacterium]
DNLWLTNATHANQMAQLLRKEMSLIHPFEFTYPTHGNIIIVKMDREKIDQLLENHFFYVWDEANNEIRLVTSWDTTHEDIELFISDLKKIYS